MWRHQVSLQPRKSISNAHGESLQGCSPPPPPSPPPAGESVEPAAGPTGKESQPSLLLALCLSPFGLRTEDTLWIPQDFMGHEGHNGQEEINLSGPFSVGCQREITNK